MCQLLLIGTKLNCTELIPASCKGGQKRAGHWTDGESERESGRKNRRENKSEEGRKREWVVGRIVLASLKQEKQSCTYQHKAK